MLGPHFVGAPTTIKVFGHIRALARHGDHYVLRFDPADLLEGSTARMAAAADGVIKPGDVVTNDFYIRDTDHKVLTYIVPGNAKVTVAARTGSTPIHVFELARAETTGHARRQYNPAIGFWISVSHDAVRRLDQMYLPCPPECHDGRSRSQTPVLSGD